MAAPPAPITKVIPLAVVQVKVFEADAGGNLTENVLFETQAPCANTAELAQAVQTALQKLRAAFQGA